MSMGGSALSALATALLSIHSPLPLLHNSRIAKNVLFTVLIFKANFHSPAEQRIRYAYKVIGVGVFNYAG